MSTLRAFCGAAGCQPEPRGLGENSGGATIGLTAPVGDGQRCLNRDEDVRRVQTALNRFSVSEGGPAAPLDVDGRYGTNTRAAVWSFQRKQIRGKQPDGIVDPGKATERALAGAANTYSDLPAEMEKHRVHASSMVVIARTALTSARMFKNGLPDFTGIGKANWDKACEHFGVDKFPGASGWSAAMDWVDRIYVDILTAIGHVPQGLRLIRNESANEDFDAYAFAFMGGYQLSERNKTGWHGYEHGGIYLTARMQTLDVEAFSYALIHEAAHFVGPTTEAAGGISDYGYQHIGHAYERLLPWQRTHNADCYSQFAFAAAGRPFRLNAHQL